MRSIIQSVIFLALLVSLLFSDHFTSEALYQTKSYRNVQPVWSPDGNFIAFVAENDRERQIWIIEKDGSNAFEISSDKILNPISPNWSPDGSRLAVVSQDDEGIYNKIWIIQKDSSMVELFEPNIEIESTDMDYRSIAWSPSGDYILLSGCCEYGTWLVNMQDETAVKINDIGFATIAWSPDESLIAFSTIDFTYPNNRLDLFTADYNGSNMKNLTPQSTFGEAMPAWSPDGNHLAFVSDREGSWDIWVMDTNGSNPINLTPETPNSQEYSPTWSPDGCCIAFSSDRIERYDYEIWVLNFDQNTLKSLTQGLFN